jgi:hypothetical protein
MGSTVAEVIKALDQPDMLTHDVYYVLGGFNRIRIETFQSGFITQYANI